MQIPRFPEFSHPLIQSLTHHSDQELLTLFKRHPEQGKYFIALFCRYSPIIYTLITPSARSPRQADYLFALTWREIFVQLPQLTLKAEPPFDSLQNWLIYTAAVCVNQAEFPPDEQINFDLKATPPPLWCYTEQALEQLPPMLRFVVVMTEKFGWDDTQIVTYLHQEGENVSLEDVTTYLHQGHQSLQDALPNDIHQIYLTHQNSA